MAEPMLIDASLFLGMHHRDEGRRRHSVNFFRHHFHRPVWMNLEQIGLCDAVIWRQPREVQDAYYPFMDLLHSEMAIKRTGYDHDMLALAASQPSLRMLRTEQALLAAQLEVLGGRLFTHDPVLRSHPRLQSRLGRFENFEHAPPMPATLESLYLASLRFIHCEEDWQHVRSDDPGAIDYAAR
jgi:hypothetical protein